jgi:hypothetical protein
MRRLSLGAVAIAVLYVACVDPPKKLDPKAGAGTGGTNAGENAGGDMSSGATSGSDATGGTAGSAGSGTAGTAGTLSGSAGEGGATDGPSGDAGAGGDAGAAGAGPIIDPCADTGVGETSELPPPTTTGVAKPSGAVGNLKVVNWAGFKGALSYTFDDGLSSQVTHYNAINGVGVPMTFYLVGNNNLGNTIWPVVVADGHELGNHTMRHCNADGAANTCGWPGGSPFVSPENDLDECTEQLKTRFGLEGVYTFASPNGDANWALPAKTRFLVARGVYDDPAGIAPNGATNAFNLPCHISAENEPAVPPSPNPNNIGFNLIADDVRTKGTWRIILNHSFGGDGGYNPTSITEVVAAMNYAKDLEDVWIDTVVSIAAYWRAQKTLSTVVPVNEGSSKVYSWTLPDNFPPRQYLRVKVDGGKVKQCGTELNWDEHGYYEIALDAGAVTISP